MVDIKRQDITLSDWTKWISADEFAWGSYFYSEWIQTWYSTKWFKLWPYLDVKTLNERTQGFPVAAYPCKWNPLSSTNSVIYFTHDGKLEMQWPFNWGSDGDWGENGWGAIFSEYAPQNIPVNWGYVYWDYALILSDDFIQKIEYKKAYKLYWQSISNPNFENDTTGWTVWAWWTWTNDWMKHTTGQTGTLVTNANAYDTSSLGRLAIKIANCTAGNVTISINNTANDSFSTEAWRNGWFTEATAQVSDSTNYTITITPSSDFNGYVEAVNFGTFDMNHYEEIQGLTDYTKHMAIEWAWDIYISSWNTIDVLSTLDWKISDSKKLVREDEEIVGMTQQGDSLIIWATNWVDSHQYYWNWVDSVAAECIAWKWQVIKAVTWTETISYVLAGTWGVTAWYAYRLYSVSWYQRSLIASNAYKVRGESWNLDHYHPSKKFVFNDTDKSDAMCIFMDNLYLPWCDWIYQFWQTIPWLSNARSKPINYANGSDKLFLYQDGENLWFSYRNNQRNYYVIAVNGRFHDYGYLVTDSIYRDKLSTRKALEKLKLWYKSIPSTSGNIKIYAIVDDDYFWRFDVTWVSSRPEIWDTYEVAEDTIAEIININKTSSSAWEITFRTISNRGSLSRAYDTLFKVSGEWDNSLTTNYNYDNMCLIKTIETENQEYGSDLIFGKDFVNNYIPYWHKIQFVIEINRTGAGVTNTYRTPEIFELSMVSDITDITL